MACPWPRFVSRSGLISRTLLSVVVFPHGLGPGSSSCCISGVGEALLFAHAVTVWLLGVCRDSWVRLVSPLICVPSGGALWELPLSGACSKFSKMA